MNITFQSSKQEDLNDTLSVRLSHTRENRSKGKFLKNRDRAGGGAGGAEAPSLFWLIRSLLFVTLVNQVCLLQKKYITLFYVKHADLLGNAALFWFVHFDPIYFFEGFPAQTRPDEAVCRYVCSWTDD